MNLSFADTIAQPDAYLPPAPQAVSVANATTTTAVGNSIQERVDEVSRYVSAAGYTFEPWQIAAYITAVRTKPFVILAGVSGTGKSALPRLIASATDAECVTVAVRPDWTDSSELLGFQRLDGQFQPGVLLRFAKLAEDSPAKQFFLLLDEMNLARVEYYLAEVLSHLESRRLMDDGRIASDPLIQFLPETAETEQWRKVRLPDNLCIVGSVNMDETTHGFSRKVLDRAFVIEFSAVDLSNIGSVDGSQQTPGKWTSDDWRPASLTLAGHDRRGDPRVTEVVDTLRRVNEVLEAGQLQFGYRVRDEIALFCLAAQSCSESFTTTGMGTVDPLDLAIAMKVLPRIQGSGPTVRSVLDGLGTWAGGRNVDTDDSDVQGTSGTGFPQCSQRINLMSHRLRELGFASYWL